MRSRLVPRLWLYLPSSAACWADVAMTLVGQPARYWADEYAAVDEFNPLARILLAHHPATFAAAAVLAWAAVGAALLVVSRPLAMVIAFVVTFCHAVAAAGWLLKIAGLPGAVGAVLLLVATERLVALSWLKANPDQSKRHPAASPGVIAC